MISAQFHNCQSVILIRMMGAVASLDRYMQNRNDSLFFNRGSTNLQEFRMQFYATIMHKSIQRHTHKRTQANFSKTGTHLIVEKNSCEIEGKQIFRS